MEPGVVHKTFQLIEALASTPGDQTLGEIAAKAELPKSTTHRILKDLVGLGYVSRADSGIYRLSDKFKALTVNPTDRWLARLGQPILQELYEAVGRETVSLGVLRQDKIVYVSMLESDHALRRFVEVNEAQPYHVSALGRAIVAHLPPQRREHLVGRTQFKPLTSFTVTDPDEFRAILQQVKKRGYALEMNQADQGVGCVGAPVFNGSQVIAAISMTMPLARLDDEQLNTFIPKVCAAATKLSELVQQGNGADYEHSGISANYTPDDAGEVV